ncbi:MAG TPA: MBL fold metallo-hydrolase [Nakamurella sp.]|nr:MBL fold metallo-hydrolase [Nakamurella sp.]
MQVTYPICRTCGVQYEPDVEQRHCPICEDERQYVPPEGQQWTSLAELRVEGHRSVLRQEVQGLWGIGTDPRFAIGQRALLVPGDGGNLLWDCVTYLDERTVAAVRDLGGIAAIAISHPHYYSSMIEWSEAFGRVPVYVHARDASWVQRRGNVALWDGERVEALPGRTLWRAGIHFAGGTILQWSAGGDGRGALCTGDIFQVVEDRRWISFMYSYPNYIPEHPDTIMNAVRMVEPLDFEVIYGAWWGKVVTQDAKGAVARSAERYLRHIGR